MPIVTPYRVVCELLLNSGCVLEQGLRGKYPELQDAENLLGRPIQVELVLETGLDVALESLVEIAAGGKEVCAQVAGILRSMVEAEQLVKELELRHRDLKIQLDNIKKHCLKPDKPLCDLIPDKLMDIKFTTKMITNNSRLNYLKQGGIDTLSASVLEANAIFTGLPMKIEKETKPARTATTNELSNKKAELATAATAFDVIKSRTDLAIYDIKKITMPNLDVLLQTEYWRWLIGFIAGMLVIYIWALITGAMCCGCCGAEKSSTPTLIVTLIIVSIVSIGLWLVTFSTLIVGGHAETGVCGTLHEDGDYYTLTHVVNTLQQLEEGESYLSDLLFENSSFHLPLGRVLQECQEDKSTYKSLDLDIILDIETMVNVSNWQFVHSHLEDIHVDLSYMQIFTPKLLVKLGELQQGLLINITSFRTQLMGPVGSDLEVMSNQLMSISRQISDLNTITLLDSLVSRTKRMLSPLVHDLENHKENLVYHLTALELKINPLLHQVNQSLSHMKAVQYYVTNQGSVIAQQKVKSYLNRIENYLEQYQDYVLTAIGSNFTTCNPLYEMFNSMRSLVCRESIDPLNGFWFTNFWCLVTLMLITPICLKLIDYYNQTLIENAALSTSESYVNGDDSGDWSNCSPPEADSWR